MAYRKQGPPAPRGPAGPAGNLGRPKSFHQLILTFLAAHDHPSRPMGSSTPRIGIPARGRTPRKRLGREYVFPVARRTDS